METNSHKRRCQHFTWWPINTARAVRRFGTWPAIPYWTWRTGWWSTAVHIVIGNKWRLFQPETTWNSTWEKANGREVWARHTITFISCSLSNTVRKPFIRPAGSKLRSVALVKMSGGNKPCTFSGPQSPLRRGPGPQWQYIHWQKSGRTEGGRRECMGRRGRAGMESVGGKFQPVGEACTKTRWEKLPLLRNWKITGSEK